jgi:hypothetical protein
LPFTALASMMTSIVTSASEDGKCSAGSRCMEYKHFVHFVQLPHPFSLFLGTAERRRPSYYKTLVC